MLYATGVDMSPNFVDATPVSASCNVLTEIELYSSKVLVTVSVVAVVAALYRCGTLSHAGVVGAPQLTHEEHVSVAGAAANAGCAVANVRPAGASDAPLASAGKPVRFRVVPSDSR